MRFTMAGKQYDLTQDQVRASLVGHQPEAIQQYWVEIDGVHWPVKQVLRLATGSRDFQSLTARGQLQKLKFVVGGDRAPRTASVQGPPSGGRTPFDLDALTVVDSVGARVAFSWHLAGAVTLGADGRPQFPRVPDLPGVYRLDFVSTALASASCTSGSRARSAVVRRTTAMPLLKRPVS